MSDYHLAIAPDGTEKAEWKKGIGTGGYIMKTWEPGVRSLVTRNPNYWKEGRAHFDEVEMIGINDTTTRTSALKTGEVDVIPRCDRKTIHLLAKTPGIQVIETNGTKHFTIPMRSDLKPYSDNNVRLALKYAIDRKQLLKSVLRGHGIIGNDHPISPANRYFASELPQREYDPDKARYYLKRAGLMDHTFNLHAADAAFPGAVDVAVLYREYAAKTGINIKVVKEANDGYWSIHANPAMQSTVRQGVTTEIVGNCGFSMAPLSDFSRNYCAEILKSFAYDGPVTWSSFAEYLDTVAQMGTAENLVWFVGHNAIRTAAGAAVPSNKVTADQMKAMENYVKEAMDAGALGLSTGLEYDPGRMASMGEVTHLAKIAGAYGGMYASHIRNYDEHLQPAVEEFVRIVKESNTRGQLSHLNVRKNTNAAQGAWLRAVETLEQTREKGLDIQTDCVGYENGIGKLASILPPWVLEGGAEQAALRLQDATVRKRLRTECDRYWRFIHRGDWWRVTIIQEKPFPEIVGKNFEEIAELWGKDPWDCYFDIMAAAGAAMDDLIAVGMLFTEEHVTEMVSHPLFSLEADIISSDLDSPLRDTLPFKASYAGMIHFLTCHVRQRKTLRLEDAVRKMTSMPATHFGLRDRGLLRRGYFADVVVLDYEKLDDAANDSQPFAYAKGVEHVTVNGIIVIDHSEHTGKRPGRILLHA